MCPVAVKSLRAEISKILGRIYIRKIIWYYSEAAWVLFAIYKQGSHFGCISRSTAILVPYGGLYFQVPRG
jgi:hypothetical protein